MSKRTSQIDLFRAPFATEGLKSFQEFQEQLTNLNEVYSQARIETWQEEIVKLERSWENMAQEWEDTLTWMEEVSGQKFNQIGVKSVVVGTMVSQSLHEVISRVSEDLDNLGDSFEETLRRTHEAWLASWGRDYGLAGGFGSNFISWTGTMIEGTNGVPDWFHHGGVIRSHQGMVIPPTYLNDMSSTLKADERLVITQTGEGILPRDSMGRLGPESFEALRTGQFERIPICNQPSAPHYQIQIKVQALDGESVSAINWDRLMRRHIIPVLKNEQSRRLI
jgi:hypothetical protein